MTFLATTAPLTGTETGVSAPLAGGFILHVDILSDWLVRVAVVPEGGLAVDRTWMVAPDGDVPWQGRDRLSHEGFAMPPTGLAQGDGPAVLNAGDWRISITGAPLRLVFDHRDGGGWKTVLADREGRRLPVVPAPRLFRHFQSRALGDRHYGLGDKTGPLDHTGRRLRVLQTDALGYNAETADPLYKHAPFVIADGAAGAVGLFYDTMSEITFDLGAEHSNYHPHYRHVDAAEKGLVYYVVAGPKVRDIVPRLMQLTGRPHFQPRWSMGFAFTTMHHADAPNAQAVMTGFAERCRAEKIPISAIHSGSGYTTKADGRRYVFTWNETKFPDRAGFFRRLGELGFFTCANVKPVLLTEHPAYPEAAAEGWFVRRADGQPAVEMFWGGNGSSLDFTNPATVAWWKEGITGQVLDAGFGAAWNDNNECELWDEEATVEGFGAPLPAIDVRPVHALLMTRATYEATLAREPEKRPYTISRAGPIGIARYGETWSGDNRTSWHTLKWNLRQGLSMSLSGMPLTGHDIGGFDGPAPGPELFVRWVQMMALHPRAVMNSWKPQLSLPTNLPWMHGGGKYGTREAGAGAALPAHALALPVLLAGAPDRRAGDRAIVLPFRRGRVPGRHGRLHARAGRAGRAGGRGGGDVDLGLPAAGRRRLARLPHGRDPRRGTGRDGAGAARPPAAGGANRCGTAAGEGLARLRSARRRRGRAHPVRRGGHGRVGTRDLLRRRHRLGFSRSRRLARAGAGVVERRERHAFGARAVERPRAAAAGARLPWTGGQALRAGDRGPTASRRAADLSPTASSRRSGRRGRRSECRTTWPDRSSAGA